MNLFQRLDYVWQITGLSPGQTVVLVNLAFRADENSLSCYPSAGRIAADTGMSRRGVQKVIEALARLGLIAVLSSGSGKGRNAPNRYRLTCLEMANPVRYSQGGEWRTAGQGMANGTTVNGEPRSHEPSNRKRTVQSTSAPAPEARAPRRSRAPEPGESPQAKEVRQLIEVAATFGWNQQASEDESAYLNRIRELNRRRMEAMT